MKTNRIGSPEVGCREAAGLRGSRGHSLLEFAFGYLLAHKAVASVIAGATKPEQVQANAAAAGWRLTQAELAEVANLAG